ncbi:MAG: response regulator transcription factor [Saprospiraceae bacterium]|nr:response regulator transcription factor [Saprospiraceae bacterium]
MNTHAYNCIIIDDEFHCRELLAYKIERFVKDLKVLQKFSDIQSAVVYLNRNRAPDIIFLDLELPGLNGFQFMEMDINITSQIIITSAYEKYALKTIKFHVADFLLKPINEKELATSVVYVKSMIKKVNIDENIVLSPKEMEIWILLADGLLNKEIAHKLNISTNTVKNHLQNIYFKLQVQNRSEAIIKYMKSH